MARVKKDGRFVNYYLEKAVVDRLDKYCTDTGLAKTTAIERILGDFFKYQDLKSKEVKTSSNIE